MTKKIFLIFLGVTIALIIGEGLLRLGGLFYYKTWMKIESDKIKSEWRELSKLEKRQEILAGDARLINILCVGDSWTFGAGADPGYSYPAQLQMMLDKQSLNKYKVYNAGIPGCTSSKLLRLLPRLLEEYKANIVIILVGVNDMHNPYPYELGLLSNAPQRYYYQLKNFIMDLRIYKLIRFGLDGLKKRFISQRRQNPGVVRSNINSESTQYAQVGLDFHHYESLGQYDKALSLLKEGLDLNPYTSEREFLYRDLFRIYQYKDSPRDKIEALIKRIPSDEVFKNPGMPFVLKEDRVIKNLEHNLEKIITLIKAKKAIPILQTYSGRYPLNDAARTVSKRHGLPLVDNEKYFERLSDITDYFATDDRHPNENGYYLIARNVYKIVLK